MTATEEPIYTGDEVILRATIYNRQKVLADPSSATGRVVNSVSGTDVAIVFAKSGTGIWEATWVPTEEGVHWWSCNANGSIKKSGEKSVTVLSRRVPTS